MTIDHRLVYDRKQSLTIAERNEKSLSSQLCEGHPYKDGPTVLAPGICKNQRLVDIFVGMDAYYRETWLTHLVMCIEDQWRNTQAVGVGEPDTVRITFYNGPVLQYASRKIVCDIASALQECSDWRPSDVMAKYLSWHRKIEDIQLVGKVVAYDPKEQLVAIGIGADGKQLYVKNDDDLVLDAAGNPVIPDARDTVLTRIENILSLPRGTFVSRVDLGETIDYRHHGIPESTYDAIYSTDIPDDKPTRFSDAPFKVIRDYLYACSFLSPFAPGFVDYANDLLAYRLSYAISQEKDVPARDAIANLARELNDFAKNHANGAWGLRASAKVELFSGAELPALTVRSDFGIITVDYEPELTMLDWENRYAALRTRHG